MTPLDNRLEAIRQLPLHQFMGLQSLEAQAGEAHLRLTVIDNAINPGGMLHGGVVYTLADVSAYAAVLSLIEPEQEAVTHDLHVSVLRPANRGDQLHCHARVLRRGRNIAFVDVTVEANQKTLAVVRVTKSIVDLKPKTA